MFVCAPLSMYSLESSRRARLFAPLALTVSCLAAPAESFDSAKTFMNAYCQACHTGKTAVGGFDLRQVATAATLRTDTPKWQSISARVRSGEMPPKGSPAPPLDARESFVRYVDSALREAACADGITAGAAPVRRLNREEYAATVRDLLSVNFDVGHAFPAEGAGGEGFDNAAETLFLSPIHAEKYLDSARAVLEFAATDSRARARIFVERPGGSIAEETAARNVLEKLLPRAFRRPVDDGDVAPYLALYREAREQGERFEPAVLFALRAVLVSPQFLFRVEPPNHDPKPRLIDDYALASRLSYFLWGTMPDEMLFDVAAAGKLNDPEVLRYQIGRMLRHPKSLGLVQRFTEQWLRTRDLGREKSPDPELFPIWAADEPLRSDIRYQPVVFFKELLVQNRSLLDLIDSDWTMITRKLSRFYNLKVPLRRQAVENLHPVQLPPGSDRGGLLGMSAVLAVSSYPNRTSPVLRGAWVLETLLGTPPPPAPPGVPPLENSVAASVKTVRERLVAHRANPTCASCHNRIDPIGFALENYNSIGQWRTVEAGRPVDASTELPDGTYVNGPKHLKSVLMDRKDLFIRNLTSKMLGYALGRGLTLKDSCTVDDIVRQVEKNHYHAQSLVEAIVFSVPFRYHAGAEQVVQRSAVR
jgi:mono/diheme cytochrome c family protein